MFDLILYVPSTIFQLYRDESSLGESVLSWDKCVFLKEAWYMPFQIDIYQQVFTK